MRTLITLLFISFNSYSQLPEDAYYGAQTQRAVENFQISNLKFSEQFIKSLALIKKNAAIVNLDL